jgi:hypothetical protein
MNCPLAEKCVNKGIIEPDYCIVCEHNQVDFDREEQTMDMFEEKKEGGEMKLIDEKAVERLTDNCLRVRENGDEYCPIKQNLHPLLRPLPTREEIEKIIDENIQPKMPSIAVAKGVKEAADKILELLEGKK